MTEAQRAHSTYNTELASLVGLLRPKLHRYCARMAGSAIDGEDVLQEALEKAVEAFPASPPLTNPEGWLFRIAHNAALDFLRRRRRIQVYETAAGLEMSADLPPDADRRIAATASLRTFMQLPTRERSCVILMDVLGYSLSEIGTVTQMSIPTIKALLHRGRNQLRTFAAEPIDKPLPVLSPQERERLFFYVERFNARDFEALRDRLADEVKAELVGQTVMRGRREVSNYYGNYASDLCWFLEAGAFEGHAAALVFDNRETAPLQPAYIVLLRWEGDLVMEIKDFRYARYIVDGADFLSLVQ